MVNGLCHKVFSRTRFSQYKHGALGGGYLHYQSPDKLLLNVNQAELTNLFIPDGTQAARDKVVANYRAEPAIQFTNTVALTSAGFGSMEKVYIKTLQDIVTSPGLQDRMITAAGIKTVYEVNTSHSPFLSQPKSVGDLLEKVAK